MQGDDCLRRVAAGLKTLATRPRDVVARYGGEEFVLLLPDTDADGALNLARQCVDILTELCIPHATSASGQCVTASLGVGTMISADGMTAAAFTEQVDQLLYAAKRGGRNRIEAAPRT